jgi:broad specificity phosphatase PhoE
MRRFSFLFLGLVAAFASCLDQPGDAGVGDEATAERSAETKVSIGRDTVIIVVRHAERANDDPVDPSLSAEGLLRAQELAKVLADTKVNAIYTSQFRRTKQTAEPLALANGITIQERPITGANLPTYAASLADEIRLNHRGQTVLVVNHSNTVPDIVTALSGVAAAPIPETEFSRLYTVSRSSLGDPRVVAARY